MKPETLADEVLKETFRPKTHMTLTMQSRSMNNLRDTLQRARKFVLDESMSTFLADLVSQPFMRYSERSVETLESLRHSARLPFPTVWIEFDFHAFRKRSIELELHAPGGRPLPGPEECPKVMGYLLEEHPQVSSAVRMTEFFGDPLVAAMPFSMVWQTTEDPLPWKADTDAGMFVHGIAGFFSPQYGIVYDVSARMNQQVQVKFQNRQFDTNNMVPETSGSGRYAICLLAALDDIPVLQIHKQQSRGFVARGRHRKFMDYQVLKLNVPIRTNTVRLARKLIAYARRRAHQVRGHWRNHNHEGSTYCEPSAHTWTAADEHGRSHCIICNAKRTWINQHQRGDATLGFVTHDYSVGHEV